MSWWRTLFARRFNGPDVTARMTHSYGTQRLTPEQEAELWKHFHAAMDEMDKAFKALRNTDTGEG